MSKFFTAARMQRWAKRGAITGVVGLGLFGVDQFFFDRVATRSVYTLYNGAIIVYKLKRMKYLQGEFDKAHEDISDRILRVCTYNGGLYIKFGQQIAGMGHVLPPMYAAKFRVLYDDAPTVPFERVKKLFREEFGKGPDELFSEFDPVPIAAASIAQVHRATLKNGQKVAVKIQKPELKFQVDVDLFMYKFIAEVLEYYFKMPVTWSIDYQVKHLKSELDFKNEASNAERAAQRIIQRHHINQVYIPKVNWDLTSRRVMTAEWIDDVNGMLKTGYDLPKIMNTIVSMFAYQIFYTGFLHCDPHPGNILIRPHPNGSKKPQIVLLDHGLYITESQKFRKEYCTLWKSLMTMDVQGVNKICEEWGIGDSKTIAIATLSKPYSQNRAVHENKVSYKDVHDMHNHYKDNLSKFLQDTTRIPLELVFVGRNLNIVRGNNKYLGSPVNRIKWALNGIEYEDKRNTGAISRLQYALSAQWNYIRYQSTLFAIGFGFRAYDLWKRINRALRGVKYEGDEYDDEWTAAEKQRQKKQYGHIVDENSFSA